MIPELGPYPGTTYQTIIETQHQECNTHRLANLGQVAPADTRSIWTRNRRSGIRPLLAQDSCDGGLMHSKTNLSRARRIRKRSRLYPGRRQLGWTSPRSTSCCVVHHSLANGHTLV